MNNKEDIKKLFANPLFILFLILQLFIIILVSISLSSLSGKTTNEGTVVETVQADFKITNMEELLPEFKKTERELIEKTIYSMIARSGEKIKSDATGVIQKKTLIKKKFKEQNLDYYNFVVEVESVPKSLQVKYERSKDENNPYVSPDDALIITCVDNEEKTQSDAYTCSEESQYKDKTTVIYQFSKFEDFGDLNITISPDDVKTINIDASGSDMSTDEATEYIKKWIRSMGYSTNGFTFRAYKGETWNNE